VIAEFSRSDLRDLFHDAPLLDLLGQQPIPCGAIL
jgi:hypothetical protein